MIAIMFADYGAPEATEVLMLKPALATDPKDALVKSELIEVN